MATTSSREDFLKILPKCSVGAEIGVFKGEFTKYLLTVVHPIKLHLIDPYWLVYGKYFKWNTRHDAHGRLTTLEAFFEAQRIIKTFDQEGVSIFHIGRSVDCLSLFQEYYFDWVYLDSTHVYEDTCRELQILRSKVKPCGLITGHDWREDPNHIHAGVRVAVLELCQRHRWTIVARDNFSNWAIEAPKS